jgi:hypothetical protein
MNIPYLLDLKARDAVSATYGSSLRYQRRCRIVRRSLTLTDPASARAPKSGPDFSQASKEWGSLQTTLMSELGSRVDGALARTF